MAVPRQSNQLPELYVVDDTPPVAVLFNVDGKEVVRYFASDDEADAAITPEMREESLAAIGAWRDMDFNEFMDELDRSRHGTSPTPLIESTDEP